MVKKLKEFQETMHWTNDDMIAQFHWALCVEGKECAQANECRLETLYGEFADDHFVFMMGWE